jgi:ATP-dependent RNA helicase RhlE
LTSPTFETFGFAEPLARALTQVGYTTPTPIQVQALPPQLEGRDLLGLAETGSGKTATFVLPLLQAIAANPVELGWKQVHTLILAPTRELAVQIDLEVASLARNMNIRRAVILGGVSKGPQINALKRGVHVCVATPGRLLDHVNMRSCDLSGVHTLVLDEADRMFDMGFIRDIKKIVSLIPMKRRTALFSATMPPEIRKFAYEILQDPFRVDLSTKTMVVDRIDQKVMVVRSAEKQSRLHTILADPACERVIVFTRTKRGADRVAERLGMAGINSAAFHGNKAQNARQRALNDFMAGSHTRVLVATDIAARGIDVNGRHARRQLRHAARSGNLRPSRRPHCAQAAPLACAISLCDPVENALKSSAIERPDEADDRSHRRCRRRTPADAGKAPAPRTRCAAPRRRARKGPPRGDRKPFGDRAPRDAGRADSDRAPRRSFDRHDDAPRAPRTVEAGGFNPAAELHRPDTDRPADRPARSERPARGDRPERAFDKPREFKPREFKPRDGAPREDRPRADKPRFDKPREGGRSERPRSEGFKVDAPRGEGRSFESRGPSPNGSAMATSHATTVRAQMPRAAISPATKARVLKARATSVRASMARVLNAPPIAVLKHAAPSQSGSAMAKPPVTMGHVTTVRVRISPATTAHARTARAPTSHHMANRIPAVRRIVQAQSPAASAIGMARSRRNF